MRLGFAVMCAVAMMTIAPMSLAYAQAPAKESAGKEAPAKEAPAKAAPAKDSTAKAAKAAPKGTMVLLCPKQSTGGAKVNVQCATGEKCCYHPLFDNGSCVPQAEGCLGVVNPLPLVQR